MKVLVFTSANVADGKTTSITNIAIAAAEIGKRVLVIDAGHPDRACDGLDGHVPAIVHGSGPPFTYRLGQRPDRELRVNVKEFKRPQPDQDQQRAPGRGRPGAAVDGQRPRADPRSGGRLDDLTATVAKSAASKTCRETCAPPGSSRPRRSSSSRRPPTPPSAATTLHVADQQRVPAAHPRRRARPEHLPRQRGIEPDALDPQQRASRSAPPASSPRARRPRADRQARRAGLSRFFAAFTLAANRPDPFRLVADDSTRRRR